jgi:hypothetical protein
MKRQLFLPLFALPLLFLGCDGQAPTEPDAQATNPVFAKATMELNLHVYCLTCTYSSTTNDDFYTGGEYRAFYYFACPADKGALQLYSCMSSNGSYLPSAECDGGAGRWKRSTLKWVIGENKDPCNTSMASFYGNVSGGSQGWKLEYSPRGSGYYKTETVWDVSADAGPT